MHAALAEAFAPPPPKRSRTRRRRIRPIRTMLMGIGLVTTVRAALNPELRRSILAAIAEHFPLEELLDELVLDADVVHDDVADSESEGTDEDGGGGAASGPEPEGTGKAAKHATAQQRRRSASRQRGDSNGQRGRKPPNRGTRA